MIENRAVLLPSLPGIYLLKAANGLVIYIGKAKCLRTRIKAYLKDGSDDWRLAALKNDYTSIDYLVTNTETEALLLEAELISKHKPKYNVLLKEGQPFLYILITHGPMPQVQLVRNKKSKGTYFGPFLRKMQARSAYQYLMHTFKLTLCNKNIEHGCLKYHIGICAGSCKKNFDSQEYCFRVQLALNALKSNHSDFLHSIKEKITHHNQHLEFEKAQHLQSYVENIDAIMHTIKLRFNPTKYAAHIDRALPSQLAIPTNPAAIKLQEILGLEKPAITIDCFDISHFQSSSIVGSCIRFVNGIPEKNSFRRFKIKTLQQQNDYAALQEIVARRYRDNNNLPDLIVIDGGKGQLSAVKHIVQNTPCVSIAKRYETLFSDNHPEGIILDVRSIEGKLLIALRDYAHHFAITYQRKKRTIA